MRWRKKGKIFDPAHHAALKDFVGFAQSPQALVLEDRIRIYFSIRKADTTGKFVSQIAFADFDFELERVLNVASHQVIAPGGLGHFDEHGIFPISPLQHQGKIFAYTCGWSRRVSVSVETSTGLAVSEDNGLTFERVGEGPIFSSSLHEPFLVGDSFVRFHNGVFHMWYIFGTRWVEFPGESARDRVYKIGHATSADGVHFVREGRAIISDKLNADECQALPTVIEHGGKYHMIFCYREAAGFRKDKDKAYRLGYAFSEDLLTWIREDEAIGIQPSEGDWDSDMMCYPHLFEVQRKIYLLYNGNEFGKHGFGVALLES